MNVVISRRSSASSLSSYKNEEKRRTNDLSATRIQPLEYQHVDSVSYKISNVKHSPRRKTKKGKCSKMVSNYMMMKKAYPQPTMCSSPAEVLLKSLTSIIRKEHFWADDLSCETDEQERMFSQSKEVNDKTSDNELDSDRPVVTEVFEIDENRWKFLSSDVAEKLKILVQCVVLSRIAYGDHSFDHAEALVNLAQAYLDWKNYCKQAVNHCKAAKTILTGFLTNDVILSNESLLTLVRVTLCRLHLVDSKALLGLGNFDVAEGVLEHAQALFDIIKKLPNISESHVTWFELRLADAYTSLYLGQKRLGQAASSVQGAVDIEKKKLAGLAPSDSKTDGDASTEKVTTAYYVTAKHIVDLYQQLGRIEEMRGASADFKMACRWYKQGLAIITEALKIPVATDEPEQTQIRIDDLRQALKIKMANCHLQIAKCFFASEKFDKAESSLNTAMELFEDTNSQYSIALGKKHKFYFTVLDQMAKILVKLNKNDEAITLLSGSLQSRRLWFGDFSLSFLEACNLLTSLCLVTGNIEEAKKYLNKCKEICTVRYGSKDSRTQAADATLSMLTSQNKNNEKKPIFKLS